MAMKEKTVRALAGTMDMAELADAKLKFTMVRESGVTYSMGERVGVLVHFCGVLVGRLAAARRGGGGREQRKLKPRKQPACDIATSQPSRSSTTPPPTTPPRRPRRTRTGRRMT
jgi:hypothetical protein